MKVNRNILITLLLVGIILLSGFALIPLFVFAKETQFSWQNYLMAYVIPLSVYLPLITK
jgi:flagellar basal body-associated protein FliL